MPRDKRIDWMRDNIPGFKAMHDQAERSREEREENRRRFAHMLRKPAEPGAKLFYLGTTTNTPSGAA